MERNTYDYVLSKEQIQRWVNDGFLIKSTAIDHDPNKMYGVSVVAGRLILCAIGYHQHMTSKRDSYGLYVIAFHMQSFTGNWYTKYHVMDGCGLVVGDKLTENDTCRLVYTSRHSNLKDARNYIPSTSAFHQKEGLL